MIRVVVTGASGRMGRLVCEEVMGAGGARWGEAWLPSQGSGQPRHEGEVGQPRHGEGIESKKYEMRLVGAVAHAGSRNLGKKCAGVEGAPAVTASFDGPCDVVIDFSNEAGARAAGRMAVRAGAAVLIATTGLSKEAIEEIEGAAKKVAVIRAANTGAGIAAATELVEIAARALGGAWRVEIVESHHAKKKDAPSGTAIALADAAKRGGASVEAGQIHSLRGGEVVGEHTVRLAGPGEYLEIRHVASSRELFAKGALRAARWLAGRKAGLYTMKDVMESAGR